MRTPVLGPFLRLGGRQCVRRTLKWTYHLALQSSRGGRFVCLTPPLLKRQSIYDRAIKKTFHVWIRDAIDQKVFEGVFIDRDYEFGFARGADIQKFYDAQVASGETPLIIDCGANSGMATRYFKETYPHAHAIAVEPDRDNLELAKRNNPTPDVEFVLAGIGCDQGRADIVNPRDASWAYRTEIRDNGSVDIVSVEGLLGAHSHMTPFIIKIDIEGFESNLFSRNTQWIERFPVLVIELHDWMLPRTANSRNFLREVSRLDRDFLYRGENAFSISNTLL
jgi:FkbM family methyltransferase